MAFPSVTAAARLAQRAAVRFPGAIVSALVATGGLVADIEAASEPWMLRLFATGLLGVSLFTAAGTAAERLGLRSGLRWAARGLLAIGLVGLFLLALDWPDRLAWLRFVQLLVAGQLLVAVLPYLRPGSIGGFWQYNRALLIRFLVGAVYVAVLWIGLAVALVALDRLLGLHVPRGSYADLLAVLAFTVHPWFVLAGVPDDFAGLEASTDYPLGLKVFAQFVLIPLVSVYLVILTIYLVRVVVARTWPSGWIGWLVSSVSAAGVLALLLVHPARERADSRWVDRYGRWFFVALLPSLGMLLMAAAKRIGQYGVTEPRYFLLVLGLWMIGLAIYYGLTGSRNIKAIPESLAAVALLSAVGPWSAFAVSARSQAHRFQAILAANGISGPTDGIRPLSLEHRREASAVLRYLRSTHGVEGLVLATGLSRDSLLAWGAAERATGPESEARALRRLGIEYAGPWDAGPPTWRLYSGQRSIDVSGFDRQYPVAIVWGATTPLDQDSLSLRFDPDRRAVLVERGADTVLVLALGPTIDSLAGLAGPTARGMAQFGAPVAVEGAAAGLTLRLVLTDLYGAGGPPRATFSSGSGFVLVRRR